ncbi:GNAT family N-acetyltransferase (plasmid) [Pantoea stewartii subsp. stewartii DC283]|uniref:GNAT family N-acetyltransferase n=2 Tax=Pantoea stewartii TaxID=66269 RepID=A0ABM6KDY9_PANSE|nr:GNAT family N-acetyltransferase [Pantoea stewartii subsp. stewartii DC283]KAB0545671.1 GNAT family N-acetyltransferase [Pantoea stewartii subsp. stewartii]
MILLRKAQCSDANAIALLHVASWRDTYRNVMSLDFLENHAEDELISHWQHLLNQSSPDVSVFVAEKKGIIQGFICVMLNKNAQWGTYINSLHVSSELRGQGAGKRLLHHTAEWIRRKDSESPLYLWVFEDNVRAIHFYQKLGGIITEHTVSDMPWSDNAPVFRISWKNADILEKNTR